MVQPKSLVGTTLDRYEVIRLIGEGGMGAVYLGEHSRIQRKVAIKVLHPHLASAHPQIAQRMLNEAKAAAMIGHPGIVDVMDYGETPDGIHYLVMELLHGRELAEVLEEHRVLDPNVALAVIDHVLSALGAAHAKGIVHRDLKPDNVFLHASRTGLYEVKLLDFGISKFTENQDMRLTATGAVMGTPYYMSLEQAEGRTDVDHRTDIYAASVMLYQSLSGQRPFEGENMNQVLVAILQGTHRPLEELRPDLAPALVEIVRRGMARDRGQRFGSAMELQEALRPHWDPAHTAITELFSTLTGADESAEKPLAVIGTNARFAAASSGAHTAQSLPPQAAPPGAGPPQAALSGAAPTQVAHHPVQTHPSGGPPATAQPGQPTVALGARPSHPSGAHPQAAPGASLPGGHGLPPGPGMTYPPPPTGGRIRRETWIKIAKLGSLIFVVVLVTALIATRGCETCGEDERPKASRKHKKKKKKKHDRGPDPIRRLKNLF
ncbi:MAG: protein kinase [bacterium]